MAIVYVVIKVNPSSPHEVESFLLKDGTFGIAPLAEIQTYESEQAAIAITASHPGTEVAPVEWSVHLK